MLSRFAAVSVDFSIFARTCCVVGQLSLNTMTRMLTLGEGFGYLFSAVKEAKVVDEYTVEFVLHVLQYRKLAEDFCVSLSGSGTSLHRQDHRAAASEVYLRPV